MIDDPGVGDECGVLEHKTQLGHTDTCSGDHGGLSSGMYLHLLLRLKALSCQSRSHRAKDDAGGKDEASAKVKSGMKRNAL